VLSWQVSLHLESLMESPNVNDGRGGTRVSAPVAPPIESRFVSICHQGAHAGTPLHPEI